MGATAARRRADPGPATTCWNCGIRNITPVSDALIRKIAALPAENAGERNSRSGSIGAAARRSQAANASRRRRPAGKRAYHLGAAPARRVSADQSPYQAQRRRRDQRPAPARPPPRPGPVASLIRAEHQRDGAERDRHVEPEDPLPAQALGDAPPRTGPDTAASPVTLPKIPIAQPRRAGGKAPFSSTNAIGMIAAAPAPCTARAAIRLPRPGPGRILPRRPRIWRVPRRRPAGGPACHRAPPPSSAARRRSGCTR